MSKTVIKDQALDEIELDFKVFPKTMERIGKQLQLAECPIVVVGNFSSQNFSPNTLCTCINGVYDF